MTAVRSGRRTAMSVGSRPQSRSAGRCGKGRLEPRTYALDFTESPDKATLLQKEVAALQWFESDRGVARVREQSRPIGAEGLLTLLWVEADPGGEWWGEEQDEPDPERFTPDGRRRRW